MVALSNSSSGAGVADAAFGCAMGLLAPVALSLGSATRGSAAKSLELGAKLVRQSTDVALAPERVDLPGASIAITDVRDGWGKITLGVEMTPGVE